MAHVEDRGSTLGIGRGGGGGPATRTPTAGSGRSLRPQDRAENFLTEVEHSKLAGSYRDPDAGRVSLRKYAQDWVQGYSPDSARGEQIRRQLGVTSCPALGVSTSCRSSRSGRA